jgi:hypothetical protein
MNITFNSFTKHAGTRKNAHNVIECRSQVEFNTQHKKGLLELLTMKRSNGLLYTTASIKWIEDGFVVFTPFSDFSEHIENSNPSRCTVKVVECQHSKCLSKLDDIKQAVISFYSNQN